MSDLDALVGRALPPRHVVVERGPVVAFADAITDTNPAHREQRRV